MVEKGKLYYETPCPECGRFHIEPMLHEGADPESSIAYCYAIGSRTEVTIELARLEDVAWALDTLSQLARSLLEPLAMMDESNAETLDVTVRLTRSDRPMTSEEAQTLLGWLEGDEMQEDLRSWSALVAGGNQ